jgi:hypothetical protein
MPALHRKWLLLDRLTTDSSVIATPRSPERTHTMTRTAHTAALALSLVMTLAMFSGISHLSSVSPSQALMAQTPTTQAVAHS